jgi:hypothetical protein
MTFEIDPDLRLATRVAFGHGWRLGLNVGLFAIVMAGLTWFKEAGVAVARIGWPTSGDPVHVLVLVVLMAAPAIPLSGYLLDLERRGLLDHVRLCGRSPHRLLLLLLSGLALPLVLPVLMVAFVPPGVHLNTGILRLGLVISTAALDIALIVFGTLPAVVSQEGPALFTGATAIVTTAAMTALFWIGWLPVQPASSLQLIAGVVALASLPVAMRVAGRRVARPGRSAPAGRVLRFTAALRRLAPQSHTPEFTRFLRTTLPLAIGSAVIVCAWDVGLAGLARYNGVSFPLTLRRDETPFAMFLYAGPCTVLALGAIKLWDLVRQEFESGRIDLVRLSAQSPSAVGLGWYVATALPFAAAALPPLLIAASIVSPLQIPRPVAAWGLMAAGAALPALSLAASLARRTGVYRVVYLPLTILSSIAILRAGSVILLRGRDLEPWRVALIAVIPWLVTLIALAASVGRLRRPDGPALVGAGAWAAIAAIAVCARAVPLDLFPRFVVLNLALAASWVADVRAVPTPPWRRLAIAGGAALAGTLLVMGGTGLEIPTMLTTAAGATLAVGVGLLAYELWDRPLLSFGQPIVLIVSLAGVPWVTLRAALNPRTAWPTLPPLHAAHLAALAATLVALAIAHARVRAANAVARR